MQEDRPNYTVPVTTSIEKSRPPASLSDRVKSLRLPDSSGPPGSGRQWLPWALCLFFAGLGGYSTYRLYTAEPPKVEDQKVEQGTTSGTSQEPLPGNGLVAGGYVIPLHRVQVSPKVGGQVVELYIEEGDLVTQGQKIAKLDATKYDYEHRRRLAIALQAKAHYEKLKNGSRDEEKKRMDAALKEAEALHKQLQDEVDRMRRSGSAVSKDDFVKTESKLVQADFKVEQLRQDRKMIHDGPRQEDKDEAYNDWQRTQAEEEDAKYDLANTTVLAPVTGVILKKSAEVGNTVLPNVPSNGLSASLCDMADLKALEVDVDISERDLNQVFKGQKCEIRPEAAPDRVYKGTVSRLMPEADRSKASVSARVRIDVPDNETFLRPQMRARVHFLIK